MKEEPKLVIKAQKYGSETVLLSIRLPKDMITELENVAKKTGRSRNEVINLCLDFALEHLDTEE